MQRLLEIDNVHAEIGGKEILKGVSLRLPRGEIHALMGPNGSGKSTLANTLMGHPKYRITAGDIRVDGESVVELEADERARRGLFLAFQYPYEIEGITVTNFLRTALNAGRREPVPVSEFLKRLRAKLKLLDIDEAFIKRYVNQGFSGGEKKRNEILQMAMLQPSYAILDETDSGLDIDALKIVANGVNRMRGPDFSALLITHYVRILRYIHPDRVHVFFDGRIVRSGGPDLAEALEEKGYDWVKAEVAAVS